MSVFAKKACARRLSETGCSRCGALGIIDGTSVRLQDGWRPVGSLTSSDRFAIFSGGYGTSTRIESEAIWDDPFDCPSVVRPLVIPSGALGNDSPLRLQQDMRVILPGLARAGGVHISIRAADLQGFRNITLEATPPQGARIYRISFLEDEGIEIAGGLWVLCPQPHIPLGMLIDRKKLDRGRIGARPLRHLTAQEVGVFLPVWAAAHP